MKYIILQAGEQELPILFSEHIQHIDMGSIFRNKVLSAGFVEADKSTNKLRCYGFSEGLEIPSRPQDSEIVNENLIPWTIDEKFKALKKKVGR